MDPASARASPLARNAAAAADGKPGQLTTGLVRKIIGGVMSPDIDTARAAVLQHYHPDATFYQHAAEVHGREAISKIFIADHSLFDIEHRVVDVAVDPDKLIAFAWVDQNIWPRGFRWLFSPRSCPVLTRITFVRSAGGQLLISEQFDHVSTYYLPGLLGPWAAWLHRRVFMPLGGWVGARVGDAFEALYGKGSHPASG